VHLNYELGVLLLREPLFVWGFGGALARPDGYFLEEGSSTKRLAAL